ncbi:MAG: hypothetical protein Unbinned400contig1000_6 [Prokaryotic dsDNA virus sp.]|nr:MAG: hypothetical protein Unbinned400contig1000_6 [Prokaryotic dsDNA virus sp.]|tara:strand:- start:1529 stop:1768 length:240 start_codon:yes stop_codon:yes gene_type:complete
MHRSNFELFGGNSNLPPGCSQRDIDQSNDEPEKYYIEMSAGFWCDSLDDRDEIMSKMEDAIHKSNGEVDYIDVDDCDAQ